MLKYILFLTAVVLLSCERDPLDVEHIRSGGTVEPDGLEALQPEANKDWVESDGVLTASAPAKLELLPSHEALTLAFSFRLGEGGKAKLMLGGNQGLELPSLTLDSAALMRTSVDIRPNVWQNLEIAYLPAGPSTPALLVATYLNGNLVYYQQPLPSTDQPPGPLTLELTNGTLSVTNLRSHGEAGKSSTLASNGEVILNMPLIHYAYYEVDGRPETFEDWNTQAPSKEGYISRFDLGAIREQNRDYAIRFEGDLTIPRAGDYTFYLRSSTHSALFIDGEPVVALGPDTEGIENEGMVSLGEGDHRVRLDHYQETNWNHLLLKYSTGEQERASFNDMPEGRAIATPRSQEALVVETDDRPYLLRSFLNFPNARIYDYTDKRTHVINVGEASGPHYSYDLQNGALLQVWRGEFVDASEMWDGRGEPQVVRPLGPAVSFDGQPQWSTESDEWPDSLADFHHRRYELDEEGRPTFYFEFGDDSEVSDRVVPTEGGIRRTLTNASSKTLLTNLVAAANIRQTAPGVFEMVDPGLNVEVTELASGGLKLMEGEGRQRLVAELPPGEHLTYSIAW